MVGEIHLDQFEVSHTKDDILWQGEQEDQVEEKLFDACCEYREFAKGYRKGKDDQRGPSEVETKVAIEELERELLSPEIIDQISIEIVPPKEAVAQAVGKIIQSVIRKRAETFRAEIGEVTVKLYINGDMSPNDPYVTVEATKQSEVLVIVNTARPHWSQLKGSEGVLNYLRHCTYDAIAEWQARRKASDLDTDTIKLLKDKLLRLSLKIEEHEENISSANLEYDNIQAEQLEIGFLPE
ncbi:hypothetical protein AB0758_49470 [Tolypothrix bouteillei VB521301_2]|uniref:hypothetical protein n=1 Tax=Tolypothrix bouteillei TaxID=1246981 RepID=UPI00051462C9